MYQQTRRGEDVFLPKLAEENGLISDVDFVECTIRGPAVVVPLEGCIFVGGRIIHPPGPPIPMQAYLWIRGEGERLIGAIALRNCRFDRCVFDGIGWAGSKRYATKMLEAEMFGKWADELDWD